MTLDRIKGEIVFHCDGDCGESLETTASDLDNALSHLKEARWFTTKTYSGKWYHLCPDCNSN